MEYSVLKKRLALHINPVEDVSYGEVRFGRAAFRHISNAYFNTTGSLAAVNDDCRIRSVRRKMDVGCFSL